MQFKASNIRFLMKHNFDFNKVKKILSTTVSFESVADNFPLRFYLAIIALTSTHSINTDSIMYDVLV